MADSPSPIKQVLSQQAVLAVLDRWDDARTMMLNFWHRNPHLASQGGERVRQLLMPLDEVQRLHAGDLA